MPPPLNPNRTIAMEPGLAPPPPVETRPEPTPAAPTAEPTAPWVVRVVLAASACVLLGVTWDISWHSTVGRDTLFSPPHLAMYLGGVVAGLGSGVLVLAMSFGGARTASGREIPAVPFWKYFRGPLGAWVCIWGAIAMLTSAPFDDWWHNAYGLDVEIVSPPHALLAMGIGAINLGALLMVLPWQNAARESGHRAAARRLGVQHALAAGLLFLLVAIFTTEYHFRIWMHGSRFYTAAAIAFPVVLVAAARSSVLRWPFTATAGFYTAARLLAVWILPLFPGEPRLGPILQPVDHFVPPDFPLLLLAPAFAMDLLLQRWQERYGDWLLAAALGGTFFVVLLAVQWPFADFLQSEASQNWFFATDNHPYFASDRSALVRRTWVRWNADDAELLRKLGLGMLYAMASARIGLWLGGWMRRVRR